MLRVKSPGFQNVPVYLCQEKSKVLNKHFSVCNKDSSALAKTLSSWAHNQTTFVSSLIVRRGHKTVLTSGMWAEIVCTTSGPGCWDLSAHIITCVSCIIPSFSFRLLTGYTGYRLHWNLWGPRQSWDGRSLVPYITAWSRANAHSISNPLWLNEK